MDSLEDEEYLPATLSSVADARASGVYQRIPVAQQGSVCNFLDDAGSVHTMEVLVSDPRVRTAQAQKVKDKMRRKTTAVVFKLGVRTGLGKYGAAAAAAPAVYRRYTAFQWLHVRLGEKYPDVARPGFPGKLKVKTNKRMENLNAYMNELTREPHFLLSTELLVFLTAPDDEFQLALQQPGVPFLAQGWDELHKARPEKAYALFQDAKSSYEMRGDITGQFQALRFMGEVLQGQGRWSEAAQWHRHLYRVAQQMQDNEGAALALINMARSCHQLNDYPTAMACLTEMKDRAVSMGSQNLQAIAQRNIGMVHASLYDYAAAIAVFREELELRQRLPDVEERMKAMEAVGLMLFRMYDVQGAIATFQQYLAIAQDGRLLNYEGLALLGLGTFHDYLGDNAASYDFLTQALSIFESLNDDQNATVVLINLGIYYRRVCNYNEAKKYFRNAYSIAKDNADIEMQSRCGRNLALCENRANEFPRSQMLMLECLKLAEQVNDRRLLAQVYRSQADLLALKGSADALQRYKLCLQVCRGTDDRMETSRSLYGLGELEAGRGVPDNAAALRYFETALATATSIHYKKGRALALYGMGLIYRRLGDFKRAKEMLTESADVFQALGNSISLCRTLTQFALCQCYAAEYPDAIITLKKAALAATDVQDTQGLGLVGQTSRAVEVLAKLLGSGAMAGDQSAKCSIKAERHLSSGESVKVYLTLSATDIEIRPNESKKSQKAMTPMIWQVVPDLKVDLDAAPTRKIALRVPNTPPVILSCDDRNLVFTVLTVLTMRLRACVGQCTADGVGFDWATVNQRSEFTITARVSSGQRCERGGDVFVANAKRYAPLPEEVDVTERAEKSSDVMLPDGEGADVEEAGLADPVPINTVLGGSDEFAFQKKQLPTLPNRTPLELTGGVVEEEKLTAAPEGVSLQVQDQGDGTYTAFATPTVSGQYTIEVTLNSIPIVGSPFFTNIRPAELDVARCTAVGGVREASLGASTSVAIVARDNFDNQLLAGGVPFLCTFSAGAGQAPRACAVTDNGNGTYSTSYIADAMGDATLAITAQTKQHDAAPVHIEGSPFRVAVGFVTRIAGSRGEASVNLVTPVVEQTSAVATQLIAQPGLGAVSEAAAFFVSAVSPALSTFRTLQSVKIEEIVAAAAALSGPNPAGGELAELAAMLAGPAQAVGVADAGNVEGAAAKAAMQVAIHAYRAWLQTACDALLDSCAQVVSQERATAASIVRLADCWRSAVASGLDATASVASSLVPVQEMLRSCPQSEDVPADIVAQLSSRSQDANAAVQRFGAWTEQVAAANQEQEVHDGLCAGLAVAARRAAASTQGLDTAIASALCADVVVAARDLVGAMEAAAPAAQNGGVLTGDDEALYAAFQKQAS